MVFMVVDNNKNNNSVKLEPSLASAEAEIGTVAKADQRPLILATYISAFSRLVHAY